MLPRDEHRRRRDDVERALAAGQNYSGLAKAWGISAPGAWQWCERHCSDEERVRLGSNGRYNPRSAFRLADSFDDRKIGYRLALVGLARRQGWTLNLIALGIGISPPALTMWLKRHAPDGVDQALQDFSEDEPVKSPRAA